MLFIHHSKFFCNFAASEHAAAPLRYRNIRDSIIMTTPETTQSPSATDISTSPEQAPRHKSTGSTAARVLVWLSVVLAVATWCTLLWGNGLVAAGIAVAGIVLAAIGMRRASTALRRLAITAVIAQLVPAIVVLAYVVVLHFIVT